MLALEGERFVAGRRLEDRNLFLEDLSVADVVGIPIPADVDTEWVRLSRLGPSTQSAQHAPARQRVSQSKIFGEANRMPGGQYVDQRPELYSPGSLGQNGIEQEHVRDHFETVVLKMVLGCPHRV